MDEALTFAIYPHAEAASLPLFLRAVSDIHRLLQDVDYAVNRERGGRRWIVAELHSSAPTVTVRPLLSDPVTIDAIAVGIRIVTTGTFEPPRYFTEDALSDLKRMRRLFRGTDRVRRIVVSRDHAEPAVIEEDISEKADQILASGYRNLGSLEGTLDAINVHDASTFTMWDRVSLSPVRCFFPKTGVWVERVKSLLEKRVVVAGEIHYFRNGIPRSIANVQSIDDASQDDTLPTAYFGCIPDSEAARDPVAFLRERRGLE